VKIVRLLIPNTNFFVSLFCRRQNAAKAAPGKKRGRKPQASTTKSNAPAIKEAAASLNRSTRNRDADGNKAKKAGALAKLRQQKEAQQKKAADSDSETDYGSEEDSDEEYVAEGTGKNRWGAASKKTAKANVSSSDEEDDQHTKNYEEAGLEDFRKVTISRHRLSIWCNEPFFENVVVGAYVRISSKFLGVYGRKNLSFAVTLLYFSRY